MTENTIVNGVTKAIRFALLVEGLIAIGFGITVLFWPTKAAVALTGVLAFYAILAGIVYAVVGIVSSSISTGGRIGHVLLGLLYVIAGVFAFGSLQQSAAFLAVFITIMIGVMWIIEGFASLFTMEQSSSKLLTVLFAIISVFAGFTLITSPIWGAVFLWWFLAISLIVIGALNCIRAFTIRTA